MAVASMDSTDELTEQQAFDAPAMVAGSSRVAKGRAAPPSYPRDSIGVARSRPRSRRDDEVPTAARPSGAGVGVLPTVPRHLPVAKVREARNQF